MDKEQLSAYFRMIGAKGNATLKKIRTPEYYKMIGAKGGKGRLGYRKPKPDVSHETPEAQP